MASRSGELRVYVGSHNKATADTPGTDEGIYVYRLDAETGALAPLHAVGGVVNPSFLAVHPSRRFLYSVGEAAGPDGTPTGAVSAFALDPATGSMTFLNRESSGGGGPCHLSVDATGRLLVVANYGTGSVTALPIGADGRLGPPGATIQHRGSSVDPRRQTGPHAHSIAPDPANRFALAADLGLDQVLVYRLDPASGTMAPADPPAASLRPGSGPRHLDYHPSGRWVYVINELDSTMTAGAYDAARGTLTEIQSLSTLPDDWSGTNYCADVHVHPSGRFVYGSNRGHDSLAIFAVDAGSGRLSPIGHEPTRGAWPRNFGIDPSGRLLLAANQNSDNIVAFRIDEASGEIVATGEMTRVPRPVCVKFVPAGAG